MGYQWISRLAEHCDMTLLTLRHPGHMPASTQLANMRVIEWNGFPDLSRWPRANSTLKPWYPLFYLRARRWIKSAIRRGERFDLMHHLMPLALRFPSPCARMGIPYLIGPLAGSLATPPGMCGELKTEPIYVRLRNLDAARLRLDPLLRRTYEDAEIVVGSSPYVQDGLAGLRIRRFVAEPGAGVDHLAPARRLARISRAGLRMLYVGRVVRTKGLRDAIRAMARLTDLCAASLTVAGDGEDLAACKHEAARLGVTCRVRFLGRKSREEVERLYEDSDVFLFPSFREPAGIVLFEAMRHGLPVITTDIGGPGHIVTDASGIRVPVRDPDQFTGDLASAIGRIAMDRVLLESLADGARRRVAEIGLWDGKIERMMSLYRSVLTPVPSAARVGACSPGDG
jgi:glycosyltransferase involved in cell wall biosynthesis